MSKGSIIPVERFSEKHMWWFSDLHNKAVPIERLPAEERNLIRTIWQEAEDISLPLTDCSLAKYLEDRGYANNEKFLEAANILLAQTCCSPMSELSVADLCQEKTVDHAGGGESRVTDGIQNQKFY